MHGQKEVVGTGNPLQAIKCEAAARNHTSLRKNAERVHIELEKEGE